MLETKVSVETDAALAQLVRLSGVSKASIVRHALNLLLLDMSMLTEAQATEHPSRTSGQLAAFRKEHA